MLKRHGELLLICSWYFLIEAEIVRAIVWMRRVITARMYTYSAVSVKNKATEG